LKSISTRAAAAVRRRFPAAIFLFSDAERNVLVLDHVGYLASHGEDKENDPVAKQYGPEDGNIKHREECHKKGYAECLSHGVPEFKLRETADKWLELIRTSSRQSSSIRYLELRINKRRQKPDKQIQEVDSKTIGDDVESVNRVNPQTVDKKENKCSDPPVS
jgi:hypothetical protein